MKLKSIFFLFILALFFGGCSIKSTTTEPIAEQRKEAVFERRIQEKMEAIDTSGWETYRDEEYEYEFKYSPSFWG
ncbi:hypothetical protein KKH43_01665, partial [Patescibacteria group bacterium]|nr:hypothetical protein [Patescibacteria group bacterium]